MSIYFKTIFALATAETVKELILCDNLDLMIAMWLGVVLAAFWEFLFSLLKLC